MRTLAFTRGEMASQWGDGGQGVTGYDLRSSVWIENRRDGGGDNGRSRLTSAKTVTRIQASGSGGLDEHGTSEGLKSGHILGEF